LIALIALGPGLSVAQQPAGELRRVEVIGRAAGTDLKAADEARQDARRAAVMEGCGSFVEAATLVENYQLVNEQILAHASGYLTEEKVLREWQEEGISYCQMLATVQIGRLKDDWAQLRRLTVAEGYPRCLIMLTEDKDTSDTVPPVGGGACQSRLESIFLKHDMPLVEFQTAEQMRQRDRLLAEAANDVQRLSAYAAELKADLLLYGQAEATPLGPVSLGGSRVYRFKMTLNLNVVQADAARILASDSYSLPDSYMSTGPACDGEGFRKLADVAGDKLLRDIEEAWRKRATSHRAFQVSFAGISHREWKEQLGPALRALRGVPPGEEGVHLRELVNDVAQVEIFWTFDLDNLAGKIEELKLPNLTFEITERTGNRLKVKVVR